MKDGKRVVVQQDPDTGGSIPSRILGSLRDALAAASRDATGEITVGERTELLPRDVEAAKPQAGAPAATAGAQPAEPPPPPRSAAEAVRQAKAAPHDAYEAADPTTRVVRGPAAPRAPAESSEPRTQVVRGKPKIARGRFVQDPVVGWLVVIGGPGLGAFRPVYEGNNAIGRSPSQRIPLDFGDDAISSEEQAFIRYDSMDRSFLFVPNLSKTNVVSVNNKRPTAAVKLEVMDVIGIGRTQLAFVPFCGEEFDWSELAELKE